MTRRALIATLAAIALTWTLVAFTGLLPAGATPAPAPTSSASRWPDWDRVAPPKGTPPARPSTPPTTQAAVCPSAVGHRGAPTEAPENTVPSLQHAYAGGASTAEVDVQWTSDNIPVLMHDGTIDRTTNGTGTIPAQTWAALSTLRANDFGPWNTDARYATTRIPRLTDALTVVPAGRSILLDIHNPAPTQAHTGALYTAVNSAGLLGRTIVMASAVTVTAMRGWYPTLRTRVIEYPPAATVRPGVWLAARGDGYVVPYTAIDSFAVTRYWRQYGVIAWAWVSDTGAPDNPTEWERLLDAEVDGVITNTVSAYVSWCAAR